MAEPKICGHPVRVMRASPLREKSAKHQAIMENGIVELKLDGARALIHFTSSMAKVYSRTVSEVTGELVENTRSLPHLTNYRVRVVRGVLRGPLCKRWTDLTNTIIDGENVCRGKSYDVQTVLGSLPDLAIRKQKFGGWMVFEAFDCLRYEGVDLIHLPLEERLEYLDKALKRIDNKYIRRIIRCPAGLKPMEWVKQLWEEGKEGIIVKDPRSVYAMDKAPANSWLKVKREKTAEVAILGFTKAKEVSTKTDGTTGATKYKGQIGAIIYGYVTTRKVDSKVLSLMYKEAIKNKPFFEEEPMGTYNNLYCVPIGCLSGIDDSLRLQISKDPRKYVGKVMEIKFQEVFTTKGRTTFSFRHPRFVRFRSDKSIKEVTYASFKPLLTK